MNHEIGDFAFSSLDPHQLLDAIDGAGYETDGRVNALNSYENRVYQIGLSDNRFIVAKFYRPDRWSDETIREEHHFCEQLKSHDLPVIAPLKDQHGESLYRYQAYRFCLFPRAGGRPPQLDNPQQLNVVGRTLGRMHLAAQNFSFRARPAIDATRLGDESADFLLDSDLLPPPSIDVYDSTVADLLDRIHNRLEAVHYDTLSLHGDFHPGNILWGSDDTPQLLDFDDAMSGPAMQDLWMFISGDRAYAQARLGDLLDGYLEFREFDTRELALIEPLRSLRIIHYAAWIGRRWQDAAFKQAFPFFAEPRFWDDHIQTLREQCALFDEPPLRY